ncbi:MAG: ribbon-helix-helix protein, CopG family [Deltaproteobacteria bacterium]|nr:ribbon-helix-helix protein, CopG family [Deltaproteobacteria bacterium]
MGNTKKPMRIASFKLPEELDRALTEMARGRHMTRSALVREALEKLAPRPTVSAADLAGSLVGCLEGPTDLSTSAKHLEGFGE